MERASVVIPPCIETSTLVFVKEILTHAVTIQNNTTFTIALTIKATIYFCLNVLSISHATRNLSPVPTCMASFGNLLMLSPPSTNQVGLCVCNAHRLYCLLCCGSRLGMLLLRTLGRRDIQSHHQQVQVCTHQA